MLFDYGLLLRRCHITCCAALTSFRSASPTAASAACGETICYPIMRYCDSGPGLNDDWLLVMEHKGVHCVTDQGAENDVIHQKTTSKDLYPFQLAIKNFQKALRIAGEPQIAADKASNRRRADG